MFQYRLMKFDSLGLKGLPYILQHYTTQSIQKATLVLKRRGKKPLRSTIQQSYSYEKSFFSLNELTVERSGPTSSACTQIDHLTTL